MVFLFLLFAFMNNCVNGRNIIVSTSSKSLDSGSCGTLQSPCKALTHAILISRKNDVIILECPDTSQSKCSFSFDLIIKVYKTIQIKGADNQDEIPVIHFSKVEAIKLGYESSSLTFSNLTISFTWSIARVEQFDQTIIFNHCKLLMKKSSYVLGVGKILQLIQVNDGNFLTLELKNSVVEHIEKNSGKILLLLLGGPTTTGLDLKIRDTKFIGNMKIQINCERKRLIKISGATVINGKLVIVGKSISDTCQELSVKNTVFDNGIFDKQLDVSKITSLKLQGVSFTGNERITRFYCFLCKRVFIQNSNFYNGTVSALTGTQIKILASKMSDIIFLVNAFEVAELVRVDSASSELISENVKNKSLVDSVFQKSSITIFNVEDLYMNRIKSTDSQKDTLLSIEKCPKGILSNSIFSAKQIVLRTSKVTIDNCLFEYCIGENGGAIHNDHTTLTIKDTKFFNNSAVYHGGSIYSEGPSRINITETRFIGSGTTGSIGALIYSYSPILFINVHMEVQSSSGTVIFIRPSIDVMECKDTITFLRGFRLKCPRNSAMKTALIPSDIQIRCSGSSYDSFALSCHTCNQGQYNNESPFISNINTRQKMEEFTGKCINCPNSKRMEFSNEAEMKNATFYLSKQLPSTCLGDPIYIVNAPMVEKETCFFNRTGRFCGVCRDGFSSSLFTAQCIPKARERNYNSGLFWGGYLSVGCIYALVLMFIKELVVILNIKGMYLEIKKLFKRLFIPYDAEDFFYDENEFHYDDVIEQEFNMVEVNPQHIKMTSLNFNIGTTTGIIKILFFFYQVETLIRVSSYVKMKRELLGYSLSRDIISSVLSLRLSFHLNNFVGVPRSGLNEIEKEFIKDSGVLFLLLPLVAAILLFIFLKCCGTANDKQKGKQARYQFNKEKNQNREQQRTKNTKSNKYENSDPQSTSLVQYQEPGSARDDKVVQNPVYEPAPNTETSDNLGSSLPESPPPKPLREPVRNSFDRIDGKVPIYFFMPISYRIRCFLLLITVLGYLPISVFLFRSAYCLKDGGRYWLLMQPNVECYGALQAVAFILIFVWVIPFPIVLYWVSKLQYTCRITPREFFFSLYFPPILLYYTFRNRFCGFKRCLKIQDAMLAKHLLMVLYESFRLQRNDTRYDVLWEVMYIAKKLILIIAAVCCPVEMRLYVILIILIVFLLHHIRVKPFSNKTLNGIEACSLTALCILCSFNIFWSYQNETQIFGIVTQYGLLHLEYIILCFPLILTFLFLVTALICFILNRTCCKR